MSKLVADFSKLAPIMAFYILLSYLIGPLMFYFLVEKSAASAGNGFIVGSVVSILLWYAVGRKMV